MSENKENISKTKKIIKQDIPVVEELKAEEQVVSKVKLKAEDLLKYQLVVGSFKSEANANRLSKKIQKLEYQSIVIKMGHRYRVIASSYSTKSEAKKAKKALKTNKMSSWINILK